MRLSRLTIAQRLALLAAAVALVMTLAVSVLSYVKNRQVLVAHELVDLADESNLRMHELREETRYLMRETRETAGDLPRLQLGQDARDYLRSEAFRRSFVEAWGRLRRRCAERGGRSPSSWLDGEVIVAAYALEVRTGGDSEVAQRIELGEAMAGHPPDTLLGAEALADLQRRYKEMAQRRSPNMSRQLVSNVRPRSVGEKRQVFCIGFEIPGLAGEPAGLFVIAVDFTRMVENRARHSARHFYFVTDAQGRFVVHPDESQIDRGIADDRDRNGRVRFAFQNVPWSRSDATDEPDEFTILGESLRTGELPVNLTYWFIRRPYSRGTPFQNAEARRALESDLENLTRRSGGFRFSRQKPESREITLAAQDRDVLKAAQRIVEKHEREVGYIATEDWEGPIHCRTFAAHLVPLRLGPDPLGVEESSDSLLYLIVAASIEEIAQDIFKSTRSVLWISLALCVGAGWLALIPAVWLTRPLKRINQAAQRLAEGAYDTDLPTKAVGEIGTLARTFRHMAEQIRQRDQALMDALARMQAVLRTAADGIITFNERGVIEEWNQAAEKIFGYRAEEIRGQRLQQLMELPSDWPLSSADGGTGSARSLKQVLHAPNLVRQGRRKDGSRFWLEMAFSEVPLGDRRLITGIFRDVTRRVEDEERIRQLNELLEARVRLRTAELQEAKAKLEAALDAAQAANRAKDVFVRTISHELRTPLSAVKGFTELLLNPKAVKLRENPIPTLQKIHAASEYLLTLINDLLDVARMTAGEPIHLNLVEFEVLPFCQTIVEMAQPLMRKNQNQLVFDPPVEKEDHLGRIFADETRVRQILLNLLSNAAKFTENGLVTFRVRRQGEWIEFTVRDTGTGMTSEQMQGLFKPFYRVDNSTTRRQSGTGLGLSISKLLAERMGGTIAVESEPGVGSQFIVRIPVQVVDTATAPGPVSVEAPRWLDGARNRHTILVIDDDPLSRDMIQAFLEREGFAVVTASRGEEGIQLARELRPAAITLDVLMPNMDGWAVLAALKSDRRTHDIPVIMLTVAEDRQRGYALGASDFLTKPIDWNRLGDVLHRYAEAPGHLLVVEDDPSQREHLVHSLRLAGWQVREAQDGREALQAIAAERPAVILLDLLMPNLNGFEFLEELRKIPGAEQTPVIVVTAKDLDDSDRARLSGWVADVIAKQSLTEAELLRFIRKHLPLSSATASESSHGEDPRGGRR